ncbi:ABC transporter permease [Butyrivibrio sp. AE2015]|uniref:ABC transporter permease n=1 Tax=Butyrivibrio sp. AE2015 TaxID=1280663 RepID=UPI0003B3AE6D|nr:ABC transporter permease [Butyrivibrio sp. AE2015]
MESNWTKIIKPKTGWFEINIKELFRYKDLIFLFVKRNFSVQYKQTILGPLWFIINPLLTTLMFTLVFGSMAGFSTSGVPQFAFYLCSTALWQYFSSCLTQTSTTFTSNENIFGKVYFPRLTMPIATVLFSLINFVVIFTVSIIVNIYYCVTGQNVVISWYFLLVPVLVFQTALLGLGTGIIISSLTTKYRDLAVLVSFGVTLWMYGTPVVYDLSIVKGAFAKVIMLNPMTPIMNNFRYAVLGCGNFEVSYWVVSWITTIVVLMAGILLFNRVEKTFMDTV